MTIRHSLWKISKSPIGIHCDFFAIFLCTSSLQNNAPPSSPQMNYTTTATSIRHFSEGSAKEKTQHSAFKRQPRRNDYNLVIETIKSFNNDCSQTYSA